MNRYTYSEFLGDYEPNNVDCTVLNIIFNRD